MLIVEVSVAEESKLILLKTHQSLMYNYWEKFNAPIQAEIYNSRDAAPVMLVFLFHLKLLKRFQISNLSSAISFTVL